MLGVSVPFRICVSRFTVLATCTIRGLDGGDCLTAAFYRRVVSRGAAKPRLSSISRGFFSRPSRVHHSSLDVFFAPPL